MNDSQYHIDKLDQYLRSCGLLRPLSQGWRVECKPRLDRINSIRKFYFGPDGRKYRSKTEVARAMDLDLPLKPAADACPALQPPDTANESIKQESLPKDAGTGEQTAAEAAPVQEDGVACKVCGGLQSDPGAEMLLCDSCDSGFHIFCCTLPLPAVPEGDWFCADCLRRSPAAMRQAQGELAGFANRIQPARAKALTWQGPNTFHNLQNMCSHLVTANGRTRFAYSMQQPTGETVSIKYLGVPGRCGNGNGCGVRLEYLGCEDDGGLWRCWCDSCKKRPLPPCSTNSGPCFSGTGLQVHLGNRGRKKHWKGDLQARGGGYLGLEGREVWVYWAALDKAYKGRIVGSGGAPGKWVVHYKPCDGYAAVDVKYWLPAEACMVVPLPGQDNADQAKAGVVDTGLLQNWSAAKPDAALEPTLGSPRASSLLSPNKIRISWNLENDAANSHAQLTVRAPAQAKADGQDSPHARSTSASPVGGAHNLVNPSKQTEARGHRNIPASGDQAHLPQPSAAFPDQPCSLRKSVAKRPSLHLTSSTQAAHSEHVAKVANATAVASAWGMALGDSLAELGSATMAGRNCMAMTKYVGPIGEIASTSPEAVPTREKLNMEEYSEREEEAPDYDGEQAEPPATAPDEPIKQAAGQTGQSTAAAQPAPCGDSQSACFDRQPAAADPAEVKIEPNDWQTAPPTTGAEHALAGGGMLNHTGLLPSAKAEEAARSAQMQHGRERVVGTAIATRADETITSPHSTGMALQARDNTNERQISDEQGEVGLSHELRKRKAPSSKEMATGRHSALEEREMGSCARAGKQVKTENSQGVDHIAVGDAGFAIVDVRTVVFPRVKLIKTEDMKSYMLQRIHWIKLNCLNGNLDRSGTVTDYWALMKNNDKELMDGVAEAMYISDVYSDLGAQVDNFCMMAKSQLKVHRF